MWHINIIIIIIVIYICIRVSFRKCVKGGAKYSHEEYVGGKSKALQIIAYAVML